MCSNTLALQIVQVAGRPNTSIVLLFNEHLYDLLGGSGSNAVDRDRVTAFLAPSLASPSLRPRSEPLA